MTNGYVLGLDIGCASVGAAILDKKTGEVVHACSRLFPEGEASKNDTRRKKRQARRLNRRKKHRLERINQLFAQYQLVDEMDIFQDYQNPYELRVKGLTAQLSLEELYVALYNIAKHRGISYLDDVADDGDVSNESLAINRKLTKEQTPGQIQLERYEKLFYCINR